MLIPPGTAFDLLDQMRGRFKKHLSLSAFWIVGAYTLIWALCG